MSRKKTILKGAFVLTITGVITRCMGFFYRIFLSQTFGADGVGLYQLIFPIYALGFSLTSAGIELALSRCVSKYFALGNKKRAREMLFTGLVLTLIFSCSVTILLQKNALFIANYILKNNDTVHLLLLLSYIFPFAAIHSCIVGYYLGLKSTKIPAVSQLIEQSFRVFSVFILYYLSQKHDTPFGIAVAVLGLIIGEVSSCFFCIKAISGKLFPTKIKPPAYKRFILYSKELLVLSLPLTASRVLLNILQSIEAISIPVSLESYGMASKDALSVYGVLTGMALPCILFPSAVTNAISTMLLPTVAEIQALNEKNNLQGIIRKTIFSCTLLGTLCCVFFLTFGNAAGTLIFDTELAGKFIITLAWMCPFLYTNNTLLSIINGIGKTTISFLINVLNLLIRICSVLFIIPEFGIYGYLIGLLVSQAFVFILCYVFLQKYHKAGFK